MSEGKGESENNNLSNQQIWSNWQHTHVHVCFVRSSEDDYKVRGHWFNIRCVYVQNKNRI